MDKGCGKWVGRLGQSVPIGEDTLYLKGDVPFKYRVLYLQG